MSDADKNRVVWSEDPGSARERRIVWSDWARRLLAGELPNGRDDNDNGLIDEQGLSFDLDGNSIVIRLTLERSGADGVLVARTLEARVTCRN